MTDVGRTVLTDVGRTVLTEGGRGGCVSHAPTSK